MPTINLNTGQSKNITLPDIPTAGYTWKASGDYDDIVSVESAGGSAKTSTVGGHSDAVFTITAIKKGTAAIHFEQRRIWEKSGNAAKTVVYDVTVA